MSKVVWKSVESATTPAKKVRIAKFAAAVFVMARFKALVVLELVSINSMILFNLVNTGAELSSVVVKMLFSEPR